ncbi:MAG: OmpH family outer membrane protein [Mariprofundaceae bacterium]|nr:OmpH family outer membrane protein [Mariprofundaceae bacterium]
MNLRMFASAMMVIGLFTAGHAVAAEMKVVFVDVKSAIENTKQYRDGLQHLESIKNAKQKELELLRDKINQMDKDLLNQSMAMSPDRLSEKQQSINDMKKDFQRKLQDAQEAMTMERNRLLQGINTKFGKKIRELGKQKGYDYILTKPSVLYVKDTHDITAEVTKLLDVSK